MRFLIIAITVLLTSCGITDTAPKPLKALYLTGGCCHDYKKQQHIIPEGLSKRIDIKCDIVLEMDQDKMKAQLSKKDWSKGYDLVIYNLCHAKETDKNFVDSITKIHHEGLPAIALHCSMHSYHWKIKGEKTWNKLLGVTSPNHGPKSKISIENVGEDHPVMKGFPKTWLTPNGELYNITKIEDTATVLAMGTRTEKGDKTPAPCIWVNQYGKARVFGTTLGHYNELVSSKEYLDLLSRAALWVTHQ
ncbi:MAG: ThuA domain-containing protein [Lentisphaeraceae bacterium]|nr:ThuA domain-containing protein [Lentisphaeraceae bacterium]